MEWNGMEKKGRRRKGICTSSSLTTVISFLSIDPFVCRFATMCHPVSSKSNTVQKKAVETAVTRSSVQ
jgi:hypothetical protein